MTPQKRAEPALPVEFYKKIAIIFIVLTTALFGAVLYMTVVSATIEIVPKKDTLSADLLVNLNTNPQHQDEVKAQVFELILEKSGTFQATATSTERVAPKEFSIQVLNTTRVEQALIAKTRFQSPDGFLYRLKDRINVPAGKIVTATVVPDPGAPIPDVGTHLILPGLPLNKQSVIYGKMLPVKDLGDIGQVITTVSDADLTGAFDGLQTDLVKEGQSKLQKQVSGFDPPLYVWQTTVLEKRTNGVSGEARDSFDASLRVKLVLAVLDKSVMLAKGDALLGTLVPQDKVLLPLTDDRFKYDIVNYDATAGTALLKVSVSGSTVPSMENPLVQSARFVGLSKDEVATYLKDTGVAETVRISTMPPWLTKLPNNPERIRVILKEN